jgi:hypothetical protein
MSKRIKYVDFGIPNAKSFLEIVTLPNVRMFEASPTLQFAINAVWGLWHLHEWHWHDTHPDQDTGNSNPTYKTFLIQLFQDCPEMEHLRDLSEAAKHCGLRRTPLPAERLTQQEGRAGIGAYNVSGGYGTGGLAYASGTPQLRVFFDDGADPRWLEDIIEAAKEYWIRSLP